MTDLRIRTVNPHDPNCPAKDGSKVRFSDKGMLHCMARFELATTETHDCPDCACSVSGWIECHYKGLIEGCTLTDVRQALRQQATAEGTPLD